MVVLAHGGHWLVNVMYVAPVIVVVGWIAAQALRDRRRASRGSDGALRRRSRRR